jgi:hypothetical protein
MFEAARNYTRLGGPWIAIEIAAILLEFFVGLKSYGPSEGQGNGVSVRELKQLPQSGDRSFERNAGVLPLRPTQGQNDNSRVVCSSDGDGALAGIEAASDTDTIARRSCVLAKAGEMRFEKNCECRNFLERGSPFGGLLASILSYIRRLEANAANVLS